MGFPESYYYVEKSSDDKYGMNPPGDLIVSKFIEGKPYWLKPATKPTQKKKTLLLNSISPIIQSKENLDNLRKHIQALLSDGFDIYIDSNDKLIKLTDKNLYLLDEFKKQKTVLEKILNSSELKQRAAEELNLASSKLELIGDVVLNILKPIDDFTYSIDLYTVYVCTSSMTEKMAKEWLQGILSDNKVITQIHHDKSNPTTKYFQDAVFSKFPDLMMTEKFRELFLINKINEQQINAILNGDVKSLVKVIFNTIKIDNDNRDDNIKRLEALLNLAINLKEITILNTTINNLEEWLLPALERIAIFEIYKSIITIDTLISHLNRMSELNQLTLNEMQINDAESHIEKLIALEKLEVFDIRKCTNTHNLLQSILSSCKSLKSLTLVDIDLREKFDWASVDLSSLETLEISSDDVDEDFVKEILERAPNIKKLKLSGSFHLSQHTYPQNQTLANLESIEIERVSIDEFFIFDLFFNSNNIKRAKFDSLNFKDVARFIFPENIEQFSFTHIESPEYIDVSGIVIMINDANHLSDLTLTLNPLILDAEKYNQDVNVFSSPHIKKLNLKLDDIPKVDSKLTLHIVTSILAKNEQLTNLTFDFNASITSSLLLGDIKFDVINLQKLTYCDIGYILFDEISLSSLLNAAPNLKYLKLDNIKLLRSMPNMLLQLKERGIQVIYNTSIVNLDVMLTQNIVETQTYDQLKYKSINPNSSANLDADTEIKPNTEFNLERIFFSLDDNIEAPPATSYRTKCYDTAIVNPDYCTIRDAFKIRNEGDLQLMTVDPMKFDNDTYLYKSCFTDTADITNYYGKQTLAISNEWQALHSLSPNEQILAYHLEPNHDIEIKYSLRDNQYYIRSKSDAKVVTIDFVLGVPKEISRVLPAEIQALFDYYRSFGENKLQLPDRQLTGEEYFTSLFEQRVGACRHRSLMMKAHIDRVYPQYQARIVNNDCHSFIEVNIAGAWVKCDLGGYPARLTIDDKNDPTRPSVTPRITHTNIDNEFSKVKNYQARLRTWESKATSRESPAQFYQRQVDWSQGRKNHLIKVNKDDDVLSLRLSLQKHCQDVHRPVFYIDSPDDLVCNANYLIRNGNVGKVNKGPGGALYDFLTASYDKSNPPILIVNYNNFDADDLVRLNTLIDKHRRVDSTPVPESMRVIGILNSSKPGCYQGNDFYSRFDKVETCTIPLQQLSPPQHQADILHDNYVINLANASDWKERLLGRWRFQGNQLIFVEGELDKAIASGKPIEIQNGLWELPKFRQFWHEVIAEHQHQQTKNDVLNPRDLILVQSNGYDWNKLKKWVTISDEFDPTSILFNPTSLNDFIHKYNLIDNRLVSEKGHIEKAQGGTLGITITRSLSTDELATLLLLCEKHQVKLHCFFTDGVELPIELSDIKPAKENIKIPAKDHTRICYSNDIDAAIQNDLGKENWTIIDVSECEPNDLLKKLTGTFDQSSMSYHFHETEQALITALREGKNVVLTGTFSNELVDAITSLIIARNNDPETTGQLRIYHNNLAQFQCIESSKLMIDAEFKRQTLLEQFNDDAFQNVIYALPKSVLDAQSYSQLASTIHSKLTATALDPWQGMYSLPHNIKLEPFDLSQSETASHKVAEFNQQRLDAINTVLEYSPYVYLAGLTAVGKTTFVERILKDQPNTTLYIGENLAIKWATDDTPGTTKFLFIDEANVSTREWSEFESLFRHPPGILIDGVYYELTKNHKVIFAGNPLSYGGERKLAPFFERHGASVIFNPLPEAFIYQEIIKPIFSDEKINHADVITITARFLSIYRFLCERSTDEVLISPREIQMMALLVKAYHEKFPDQSIEAAANHYGYLIARHLTPSIYQHQFDQLFSPTVAITQPAMSTPVQNDYLLTPSRMAISQHLHDLIDLREYRFSDPTHHDAIKYGGLGGIVIEGEPGIGKSELVIHTLVSAGFQIAHLDKPTPDKPFYHLPINMSQHDKERLLLTAFDQGAIVVIDEINSAPMMERLLNSLLMGRDPNGKPPTQPGFMVIGTQNPATMEGRREATTALARRLIITTLPPYTKVEMIQILQQKGFGQETANAMVTAYESNVTQAKHQRLKPAPTFRDLMKVADDELEAIDRFVSEKTESLKHHAISPSYGTEGHLAFSITTARIQHAIQQITSTTDYSVDQETAYVRAFTHQLKLVELQSITQFSQLQLVINQIESATISFDESLSNLELQLLQTNSNVKKNRPDDTHAQVVIEKSLSSIEALRGQLFRTASVGEIIKLHAVIAKQVSEINQSTLHIQSKHTHQSTSIFKSDILTRDINPSTVPDAHTTVLKRK